MNDELIIIALEKINELQISHNNILEQLTKNQNVLIKTVRKLEEENYEQVK